MTITVAIPSYNKEFYIKRCLDSVVKEKNDIDTILLVDNCSTDSTFSTAQSYEPTVTCVLNERNLGMSGNWNRCIDLCKTEWLMILHADDEIVHGAIKHYKKIIQKYPTAGIIYANAYSLIEEDEATKTMSTNSQKEFWRAGLEAMECKPTVCSAVMVKKEAYDKLGYFIDKSLSSDVEMWHRIASKYDTVFLNIPTVIYRINASSTGFDSLTNRTLKEIKEDWDILDQQIASHYPTKLLQKQYLEKCFRRAPGAYFAVVKANIRAKNYSKVLQTLFLIIFTYRGFIPLIVISGEIIIRKLGLKKKTP